MSEELTQLEITPDNIAILRLGAESEKVVTLTAQRMKALADHLKQLKEAKPKGLVILGAHEGMFTAGADINAIRDVTDPKKGEELALIGQGLFQQIEDLACTTVAAISGTCVGGGCELVLACDYRIITSHDRSLIGLPETKLGILPGFGGTQRLPRLIGLPQALDIILGGKTLRAKKAKAVGLVDKVVDLKDLRQNAIDIASGKVTLTRKPIPFVQKLLTFTALGRKIVKGKTEKVLHKKTKGFYPAQPAALNATVYGLEKGLKLGYAHEAKELGRLIATPESKGLVNIFFLTEASKGIGKGAKDDIKNLSAVVIGAGTMGAGIAGLLAKNEYSVILKDRTEEAVDKGLEHIKKDLSYLSYLSEADRNLILNRVEKTTIDTPNLGSVNFAIEAIFEDMDLKKRILSDISKKIEPDSLIATNTSSLSVTEIASVIDRPERVVGMHFFNPVARMPLVEIIRGKETSDKAIILTAALSTKFGKFPIIVNDVPGFLVNRILFPYLNESMYMLVDGYNMRDIDKAALKFGMPMGPIRLLDEVGLDVGGHVAQVMANGYGERMDAPPLAAKMSDAGRLGKKNKKGFYDFVDGKESACPNIREILSITSEEKVVKDLEPLQDRLILAFINEAVRCLDEEVAGSPGVEAANQIDLGSVMGFGFPPFRGGLLYYANTLGAKTIADKLTRLEAAHGMRFKPWQGILERAKSGKDFYTAL